MMQTKLYLEPASSILLRAAALGAIAGIRSMAAPALLAHELSTNGAADPSSPISRILASPGTSKLLALFAGGEMLADKTPLAPDRTSPGPLIGRAVIGSLTAAAYAVSRRHSVLVPAAIGGASAIASAFAAFHLRRFAGEHLSTPDAVLGMIEDALVMAASKGVAEAMN